MTSPELLRDAMVKQIEAAGYAVDEQVQRALRSVERHHFVPDAAIEDAYAPDIVVTKRAADGEVLSCLSHPSIVALQLGQLAVRPGQRVLEIGAGAGYNAALLARLVGPGGQVTAIDVDPDAVDNARRRLAAVGVGNVEVVLADGALGHPAGAPFDRILATVGAYGIPDAWLGQLTPDGRLVVPVRIRGSVSRSIAFERGDNGRWRSVDHQMCGFVPLRDGIADDPRRRVALTSDAAVKLLLNQEHALDPAGLSGVLDRSRFEVWTGVTFGPMQSLEWLYLWLACVLDTGVCSMSVEPAAIDAGAVEPMFRASTMAVPGDRELAYLTGRAVGHTASGGRIMEVGVIGHGDNPADLTTRVAEEVRAWSERHRNRQVRFEIAAPASGSTDPAHGRFFLDRPHNPIAVGWR